MKMTPARFRRLLNLYPPYIGAGVYIRSITDDWRALVVEMRVKWFNRNAVGTHFGGSLYSMVDPHLMLLLMRLLGKKYVVWDQSAEIRFVKATRDKVKCHVQIQDEDLERIFKETEDGNKYLHTFLLKITDFSGELVAEVSKVIYIRKKKPKI
ncbi:MAG: DUF4442 domain-containing protein [Deltaproteobacteria bacterium]|nr:DUF4442 domain-containing protein [Deltaproteobacteria bacterium]